MRSMRIFIACPDEKLRLALILFLDREPGMVVVGIADRLSGLLTQLQGSEPDVLMLDRISPVQSIAVLLADIQSLKHRPRTVVFSTRVEEREAIIEAGADYFIAKDSPPDELLPILRHIWLGTQNS